MNLIKPVWLSVASLLGVTIAVVGLARPESSSPARITIRDAAFYDSEDCKPGGDVEVACPLYTMRIQGKGFTSRIQNECDNQVSDTGARSCSIAVDMKYFRDKWGFHDPSVHHRKSMWIDYECNPGTPGSKPVRSFGEEAADDRPGGYITVTCD